MQYTLTRFAAPANDFLEDARVWDHLRVPLTGSPSAPVDETLIGYYRDAVQAHIDGAGGVLGRAMITQTWVMKLPDFPAGCRIVLPLPPLQSVTSITYLDTNNASQTLASSEYVVVKGGEIAKGYIELAEGSSWPSTYDHPEAVTITFVAGYGDDASDVPGNIKAAGLLMVDDLYRHRSSQSVDYEVHSNPAANNLLAPYMVRF